MKRKPSFSATVVYPPTNSAAISMARKEVQALGAAAAKAFPEQFTKLQFTITEHAAFVALAVFGFYDLIYLNSRRRPCEIDTPLDQVHVELFQALVLTHFEDEFPKGHEDCATVDDLRKLLVSVTRLFGEREFASVGSNQEVHATKQAALRSIIKAHTRAVRNWGYYDQTVDTARKMFKPIESMVESRWGVRIEHLLTMFAGIASLCERRSNDYLRKVRRVRRQTSVLKAANVYLRMFPDPELIPADLSTAVAGSGKPLQNALNILTRRSFSFLLPIFVFDIGDFAKVYPVKIDEGLLLAILENWSLRIGALRDQNQEHFFLSNPIWTRPMIRVVETGFFWPIIALFQSFCLEQCEQLVADDQKLWNKYLQRKGDFLEEAVAELMKKTFPTAQVVQGSQWRDEAANKTFENDITVIFDSVAVVIEAKAGSINSGARRGGGSISEEINRLIVAPGLQAERFVQVSVLTIDTNY